MVKTTHAIEKSP